MTLLICALILGIKEYKNFDVDSKIKLFVNLPLAVVGLSMASYIQLKFYLGVL